MATEHRIVTNEPVVTETFVSKTEKTGGGMIYFIVGALLVAVAVLGYMMYQSQNADTTANTAIERSADAIGEAADDVGDAARDVTRIPPQTQPAPAPQ
ncbi:MAG: hypothetical protein SGJ21_09350 [Alphaproteobacteria bacterium]|nr:hypothetical protein [Alphaproteobacteria bacterium]